MRNSVQGCQRGRSLHIKYECVVSSDTHSGGRFKSNSTTNSKYTSIFNNNSPYYTHQAVITLFTRLLVPALILAAEITPV